MGCAETKVKPEDADQPHKKQDVIKAKGAKDNTNAWDNQWPEQSNLMANRSNTNRLSTQNINTTNGRIEGPTWNTSSPNFTTPRTQVSSNPKTQKEEDDEYMITIKQYQDEAKRKKERDAVKRHIQEKTLQKMALVNPDLVKEKAQELAMKYDVKSMNKSTKILPPMMQQKMLSQNQAKETLVMNANYIMGSTVKIQPSSAYKDTNASPQFNGTLAPFSPMQSINQLLLTNQSQINLNATVSINQPDRNRELEDLLNELDHEGMSNQSPNFDGTFSKSKTGISYIGPGSPEKLVGQMSSIGGRTNQDFELNTEPWSQNNITQIHHPAKGSQLNRGSAGVADRQDPLRKTQNDFEEMDREGSAGFDIVPISSGELGPQNKFSSYKQIITQS